MKRSGGTRRWPTRRLDYERFSGGNWSLGQVLLPRLRDWAGTEDGVVLDYGCGDSPFRDLFGRARAYLRADLAPKGRESVVVDGVRIPARSESVDCVLVAQVLGDVPDLLALFREFYRVLRPGGHVLIFETMAYPEHDLPHDYFRVLPQGIAWSGERAGFAGFEVVRLGGLFTRFAQLWNPFVMGTLRKRWATRWLGVAGTMLMNVAAVYLDRALPHPILAPDYLARLRK